ncbi:serine/threonine-protein kinase [Homoserinimonas sp. A447]
MTRPPDTEAARALERAESDPEFEAALQAAYIGRHDLLDALWWAAHPLTSSPRGVADPATGLPELQRAVFSRAATDSPLIEVVDPETGENARLRESEHRLRQEQRLLSEDAQHLRDALRTVGMAAAPVAIATREPPSAAVPARTTAVRTTIDHSVGERVDLVPPEAPTPAGTVPRQRILLPALAGMGILSIILLLPTLSELNAGADGEASPAQTSAPRIKTEIVTLGTTGNITDPLAILERPQGEADRPPATFPTSMPLENFRALPDLVAQVKLYLTRSEDPESVCLVVVQPDDLGMTGCMPESNFIEDGIQVSGGRYEVDAFMTILTESYSLLSTGEFHYEATARVREGGAPPTVGGPVVVP